MSLRGTSLVVAVTLCFARIASEALPQTTNFEGSKILDLNQVIGDWYAVVSSPTNGTSVNKYGHFAVKKLSTNTFALKYTALTQKGDRPVLFNANGTVDADDDTEIWQLQGSTKLIGPIKRVIVEANYKSHLASVLSGAKTATNFTRRKIAMIWARDRQLSAAIVDGLVRKLSQRANETDIFTIDQSNC